jgi:hypothetical protein
MLERRIKAAQNLPKIEAKRELTGGGDPADTTETPSHACVKFAGDDFVPDFGQ